jgi:hypothetical protein
VGGLGMGGKDGVSGEGMLGLEVCFDVRDTR